MNKLILPKHLREAYFPQHGHLNKSQQDGVNTETEIVSKHAELGFDTCCPTDHGTMAGQHKLWKACQKYNIKPNIGVEFYVIQEKYVNASNKKKTYTNPLSNIRNKYGVLEFDDSKTFHCTVMVLNEVGYQNMLTLNYLSNLKRTDEITVDGEYGCYKQKPRITERLLFKYSEGLAITSGCRLSLPNTYYINGFKNEAIELLHQFNNNCENFFIELHVAHNEVEEKLFHFLKEFAFQNNIPTLVSNDYHYVNKGDLKIWTILGGIRRNLTKSNPDKITNDDFYIKSFDEMYERVLELNKNDEKNTNKVFEGFINLREKMNFQWENRKAKKIEFKNAENNLQEMLGKKLINHFGSVDDIPLEYKIRMREEFETAKFTGNCSYYLLVEDIIRWAKSKGITTPIGRGSAGSLLMLYILGITKVDPLQYGLVAERASNKQRLKEMDIDLDFGEAGYYKILNYIKEKYGEKNISNIINVGVNHLSSSIRNTLRYMEYPEVVKNSIARQITEKFTEYKYMGDEVEEIEPTINSIQDKPDFIEIFKKNGVYDYQNVLELAKGIEGTVNSYSVHASGILISNTPIFSKYPVQRVTDTIVSAFDMADLSDLGALKLDLLRVSTYSKIDETLEMINLHNSYND